MRLIAYLLMFLIAGSAVAQNPTILQGSYISNVFGNSNFVLNPNAQTSTANVTNATRSTSTPLVATTEFTLSLASGANATWTLRAFDQGMKGQNCEARFTYRGFASGVTTAQVVQNTNVVAQLVLTPSTDPRIASINFPCGDLSQPTSFRLSQTTANMTGTNEIGGIYVGLATNMANVAQAEVVVKAFVNTAQSIPNNTQTTVGYNAETLDTYGEFNTSTYIFTAKRAGEYSFSGAFMFDSNGWTINQTVTVGVAKNGTSATSVAWYPVQNTISNYFGVQYAQTLTLAVGDTARIVVLQNRGSATNIFASALYSNLVISRFPSSSELVVTPERQNVFGGVVYTAENQNLFGTTAEPTAYSSYNNSTWNKPAKLIGKAQVTTTNSGNDLGFSIPNLPIGNYKLEISGLINAGNTGTTDLNANVACNFRIVETDSSGTLRTEIARQVHQDFSLTNSVADETRDYTNSFSGVYNNTSVATRNFRLEAQKFSDNTTGNIGICQAYSNTATNSINTNITFLITPLDQPSNSALYVQGPVKGSNTNTTIPADSIGGKVIDATLSRTTTALGIWQVASGNYGTPPAGSYIMVATIRSQGGVAGLTNSGFIINENGSSVTPVICQASTTSNAGDEVQLSRVCYYTTDGTKTLYGWFRADGANSTINGQAILVRLN